MDKNFSIQQPCPQLHQPPEISFQRSEHQEWSDSHEPTIPDISTPTRLAIVWLPNDRTPTIAQIYCFFLLIKPCWNSTTKISICRITSNTGLEISQAFIKTALFVWREQEGKASLPSGSISLPGSSHMLGILVAYVWWHKWRSSQGWYNSHVPCEYRWLSETRVVKNFSTELEKTPSCAHRSLVPRWALHKHYLATLPALCYYSFYWSASTQLYQWLSAAVNAEFKRSVCMQTFTITRIWIKLQSRDEQRIQPPGEADLMLSVSLRALLWIWVLIRQQKNDSNSSPQRGNVQLIHSCQWQYLKTNTHDMEVFFISKVICCSIYW